jgi:leader peptidase (prepilin peptidase)/N-methyltransferase
MSMVFAAVAVAPALAVGSFLNVVASRMPMRRPVGRGRSACMSCAHEIAARDNVPLLSWALLRGRCRHCTTRIPARYPAVEATSAVLVAGCVLRFGVTPYSLLASLFCLVLVALSAIDLEHRIVPNRIVLPAAIVGLVARTALDPSIEWLLGALGASLFLLVAALAYPQGLGMGDVKLALLLGAMLGRGVAVALMIGFVAALIPTIVLFVRHRSGARKMAIPLVPFLALGALVTLFWGDALLDRYLSLFGG